MHAVDEHIATLTAATARARRAALLACVIDSAGVDRYFKALKSIHSVVHNRLSTTKAEQLTFIKTSLGAVGYQCRCRCIFPGGDDGEGAATVDEAFAEEIPGGRRRTA
jgi:hypothetical protein